MSENFNVYVVGGVEIELPSGEVASLPGKGSELHSMGRWLGLRAKEVPADKLLTSFEKTQLAINAMLQRVDAQQDRGFQLDEFEVSLAVSGEGTIGFVTATAEAGVVLKFKRRSPSPDGATAAG